MISGNPHTIKTPCHPRFRSFARGILIPDANDANNPIEVEYILVIRPQFCGNLSFTTTGNRTFPMAIPTPTNSVPEKRNNVIEMG